MATNDSAAWQITSRPVAATTSAGSVRVSSGSTSARLARMRRYLTGKRAVPDERVVTTDGGYREEAVTEFWVAPPGAAPPAPVPIIDPSDVEFTDRRPRRQRTKQARARKSSRSE